MFDFPRLSDLIGNVAAEYLSGGQEPAQQLPELLSGVGLDPSALAGLSENEIVTLLTENGIDVSQVLEGGLPQVLAGLGLDNS